MIKTINVQGSRDTTYHDFTLTQTDMTLTVSTGSYYRGGVELAASIAEVEVTVSSPEVDTQLEIWLCSLDGIAQFELYQAGDSLAGLSYSIDRLAWFTVPAGAETLDDVEINVITMTGV